MTFGVGVRVDARRRQRSPFLQVMLVGFLVASYAPQVVATDAGVGAGGGYGITVVPNALDEGSLSTVLLEAATSDCFLTSISVGGVEMCTMGYFPIPCVRVRNNVLGNLLEASSTRNHYAISTIGVRAFWSNFAPRSAPTNKKVGIDQSHGTSGGSSRGMSRTISRPIAMTLIDALVTGVTFGQLCRPSGFPEGGLYVFYAEADEKEWGGSLWRSIISPYYLNAATSGVSLLATSIETIGACPLDVNFMFCFGGWGTKYPTSGTFPAKSPALSAMTAMWRAQEIHSAPVGTFGPYDTSFGIAIHGLLHDPRAVMGGMGSVLAPYSPASYIQWLHPGIPSSPVGAPRAFCGVLGLAPGTIPQAGTQLLSEAINKTWIEDNTLAFAYWPRFTCCNNCSGANDSAVRHLVPEQSYLPTLTRRP